VLGRVIITNRARVNTWLPSLRSRSASELASVRITCLLPLDRLLSCLHVVFRDRQRDVASLFARSVHCSALNVTGEHTFAVSVAHILFDRLMYFFFTGHQIPDTTFCDIDWRLRGRGKLWLATAERGRRRRFWTLEVENGILNVHPGTNVRGTVASERFAR
jgi:hypothetical protein